MNKRIIMSIILIKIKRFKYTTSYRMLFANSLLISHSERYDA